MVLDGLIPTILLQTPVMDVAEGVFTPNESLVKNLVLAFNISFLQIRPKLCNNHNFSSNQLIYGRLNRYRRQTYSSIKGLFMFENSRYSAKCTISHEWFVPSYTHKFKDIDIPISLVQEIYSRGSLKSSQQ